MLLLKRLIPFIFLSVLGAGFLFFIFGHLSGRENFNGLKNSPLARREYQAGERPGFLENDYSLALNQEMVESTSTTSFIESKFRAGFTELAPILMYHYVEEPKATTTLKGLYLRPDIFENQLQELSQAGYQTVFVSEIAAELKAKKTIPAKTLALSFDDGYEDFYSIVFPLLKKYQVKATLYVIINKLDQPGYLTRGQAKELAASNLVEIGSHTFNHPDLRQKKFKDANFEISESRKILEQITGRPVLTFAYPFGYYNLESLKIVSSAGYLAAVSVNPGSRQAPDNLWLLNRLRPNDRQGQEFLNWLAEWSLGAKK